MKQVGYTPGQYFRRFYGTHAQRLHRRAVESQREQTALLGSALFGQAIQQSMGLSELAAQQAMQRVRATAGNLGATLERLKAASESVNLIA